MGNFFRAALKNQPYLLKAEVCKDDSLLERVKLFDEGVEELKKGVEELKEERDDFEKRLAEFKKQDEEFKKRLAELKKGVEELGRQQTAREERILLYQVSCYIANTVRERLFGEYWPWRWYPGLTLDVVVKQMRAAFIEHSVPTLHPSVLGLISDSDIDSRALEAQFLAHWTLFSQHVDFLRVSKLISYVIGEEDFEFVTDEFVVENPPPCLDQLSRCKEEFAKGSAKWDSDVFSSQFKTFLEFNPKCEVGKYSTGCTAEEVQQLIIAFFILLNDSVAPDVG